MIRTFLLLGLALLAGSVGAQNTTAAPTNATGSVARRCPPAGWDTVSNLDLRAWSAAPWYIQANVRQHDAEAVEQLHATVTS
jgi:hypothetical protein